MTEIIEAALRDWRSASGWKLKDFYGPKELNSLANFIAHRISGEGM